MLYLNGPNLDWQLNGKPLQTGSKFIPSLDFGYVRLEIRDVLKKDVGVYKVIATNEKGTSSSSGSLKLDPNTTTGVTTDSFHPSGKSGLDAIEKVETSASFKLQDNAEVPDSSVVPHFTTDLPPELQVDGNTIYLNCKVEPKEDSNLRIDWYHNGIPLSSGSRVQPELEFGFVTLTIGDVSARDEGIYTCKAINQMGEATTFTKVNNSMSSRTGVDSSTMHPHGIEGLESIGKLEAKISLEDNEEKVNSTVPPNFTSAFGDSSLNPGSIGHFEASLEPKEDATMTIEWTLNGKPLIESK